MLDGTGTLASAQMLPILIGLDDASDRRRIFGWFERYAKRTGRLKRSG